MSLQPLVDTTSDDIGFKATMVTGLREKFHQAAVEATEQVFEQEVKPAAKAGSPVLTGENRDSIDVSFRDRVETSWISAWLFTASGHGWLIEHGTSSKIFREITKKALKKRGSNVTMDRTPPRPYIYPAMRFAANIPARAKQIFERMLSQ
jgi:hypothetical protein